MAALDLHQVLAEAVARDASDVHIKAYSPPLIRIYGDLFPMDGYPILSPEESRDVAYSILSDEEVQLFEHDLELDLAYEIEGLCRFRCNLMQQRGTISAFYRAIPFHIRPLGELGVPPVVKYFCDRPRGLVVVTGPAGTGKSTSQAAMIDYINETYANHIMTVEDPIEFVHEDKTAMVNQREIGADSLSFHNALKWVLRQDPDVILVGEMRDLESISLTLTAAETGQLVISTLHTTDAPQTVDRIIDVFPTYQQSQVRMQLSQNLVGVLAQTLCKRRDGQGRVAAFETLVGTSAVRNMIREGQTHQIKSSIETGLRQGMMTLDQSLAGLVRSGLVAYEEGLSKCSNPKEYDATVKGEEEEREEGVAAQETAQAS